MASYNRVILVGNLTRDPEVRYIPSGTAVCDVGLAINERVKRGEDWVEEVSFVDLTIWGRSAESAAEFLKKGSQILVEGRLKQESWETEDGQKRNKLKVVVDRLQFLAGKKGANSGDDGSDEPATVAAGKGSSENIPFGSEDKPPF